MYHIIKLGFDGASAQRRTNFRDAISTAIENGNCDLSDVIIRNLITGETFTGKQIRDVQNRLAHSENHA